MKKTFSIILGICLVFAVGFLVAFNTQVEAAKPTENQAGAEKIEWNLSADVMPVPPYGSYDIPGSDIASKLIVNQPNGSPEVTITGVMNGLEPNTTHTIYLSKGYLPYEELGWDITGNWTISIQIGTTNYLENLTLNYINGGITGTLALPGGGSLWVIDSGVLENKSITFQGHYDTNSAMLIAFSGTISPDGTISGTWADTGGPLHRSGTWIINEHSTKITTGSKGWPGLFTNTIQPFQFVTDEYGSGSWHINVRDTDYDGIGENSLSVWINSGGTLLISNVFEVIFE